MCMESIEVTKDWNHTEDIIEVTKDWNQTEDIIEVTKDWNQTVKDFVNSDVVRGANSPNRRPWGRINTLCSNLKIRLETDI